MRRFKIVWDDRRSVLRAACELRSTSADPRQTSLPVVIGSGFHPFPFRTRKLSLIPPMVLYGKLYGRVGRCRHYLLRPETLCLGPFSFPGQRPVDAAVSHADHRRGAARRAASRRAVRKATVWETVWESRSLPALLRRKPDVNHRVGLFVFRASGFGLRRPERRRGSAKPPRCMRLMPGETKLMFDVFGAGYLRAFFARLMYLGR